jgi:hypothetical protein
VFLKSSAGFHTAAAAADFFGDLSWPRICGMATAAGAFLLQSAIDAFLEQRKAHGECAISYLPDVGKKS